MSMKFKKELEQTFQEVIDTFISFVESNDLMVDITLHRKDGITSIRSNQTVESGYGQFLPTVFLEDPSNKVKTSKVQDVLNQINLMLDPSYVK